MSSRCTANLDFAAAVRLAIVSVTPVIVLNTVVDLFGWDIPYWSMLCILISLLYMSMTVLANGAPKIPVQGFPVTMPPVTMPPPPPPQNPGQLM